MDNSLHGKCREYAEQAVRRDPTLRLVRGYYHCPFSGSHPHWWTVRQNGEIYDPTKDQFPSYALPELYEEFDGYFRCETCGKRVAEQTARFAGSHPFCSYDCFCKGVYPA